MKPPGGAERVGVERWGMTHPPPDEPEGPRCDAISHAQGVSHGDPLTDTSVAD